MWFDEVHMIGCKKNIANDLMAAIGINLLAAAVKYQAGWRPPVDIRWNRAIRPGFFQSATGASKGVERAQRKQKCEEYQSNGIKCENGYGKMCRSRRQKWIHKLEICKSLKSRCDDGINTSERNITTHPVENILKRARETTGHRVRELGLNGLRDQLVVAVIVALKAIRGAIWDMGEQYCCQNGISSCQKPMNTTHAWIVVCASFWRGNTVLTIGTVRCYNWLVWMRLPNWFVEQQVHINGEHEEWRKRCKSQLHVLLTERQRVDTEVNRQIGEDGVAVDADWGALVVLVWRVGQIMHDTHFINEH